MTGMIWQICWKMMMLLSTLLPTAVAEATKRFTCSSKSSPPITSPLSAPSRFNLQLPPRRRLGADQKVSPASTKHLPTSSLLSACIHHLSSAIICSRYHCALTAFSSRLYPHWPFFTFPATRRQTSKQTFSTSTKHRNQRAIDQTLTGWPLRLKFTRHLRRNVEILITCTSHQHERRVLRTSDANLDRAFTCLVA